MKMPITRRWWMFAIVSAVFFHITGATFMSLGVVLPHMVEELGWNWTNAGIGFTLLGLLTGLASPLPAVTLRLFGLRKTYAIGGALMLCGFAAMALTNSEQQYFLAACLLGLGYPMGAAIPALRLIKNWIPDRRSFAIGAFMTCGGLGGVAGPLVVTGIIGATGSWRVHWWAMAASSVVLTLLAVIFLKPSPDGAADNNQTDEPVAEKRSDAVYQTHIDWSLRETLRSTQFYTIAGAMTMTLLCGLTMNAVAFEHMGRAGIGAAIAAGALSTHSLINSLSRGFGGLLATRIDPKWLLASAIVAEIIGMLALSVADNTFTISVFVLFEGYGFGMCFYTTTILLVNYFGTEKNPEILGALNFLTTLGMVGPVIAGIVSDRLGSFALLFQAYAAALVVVLIMTVAMKPPGQRL